MIIRKRKYAAVGLGLAVSFILVFLYMFTPSFGDGLNAFEASDRLFNSISKGSVNYIPDLTEKVSLATTMSQSFYLKEVDEQQAFRIKQVLAVHGALITYNEETQHVEGSLINILQRALADAQVMFNNEGEVLLARYGIGSHEVMLTWWQLFYQLETSLNEQKRFKDAALVREVKVKGLEIAYNYYGIKPESVGEEVWKLVFALIFYVLYTMWWGYAIYFLFEAFGLTMTAGTKKEI